MRRRKAAVAAVLVLTFGAAAVSVPVPAAQARALSSARTVGDEPLPGQVSENLFVTTVCDRQSLQPGGSSAVEVILTGLQAGSEYEIYDNIVGNYPVLVLEGHAGTNGSAQGVFDVIPSENYNLQADLVEPDGTKIEDGTGVTAASDICYVNPPVWDVAGDGGVFAENGAPFYGSAGDLQLAKPVVGIASTPDGKGYWLVAADGGVFAYGDAKYFGSEGGQPLDAPVVGMEGTPDGNGYWLVAADGGIFAFGDASFEGSAGALRLSEPVVAMAPTPDGDGYWLAASDGGVFTYGDATFEGSAGGHTLSQPVRGLLADGYGGYEMVEADGTLQSFGDAGEEEALPEFGIKVTDVVGIAPLVMNDPSPADGLLAAGTGYALAEGDGTTDYLGNYSETNTQQQNLAKPFVGLAVPKSAS